MEGDLRGLFYKGTGAILRAGNHSFAAGGQGRIARMVFRECFNQRFEMFEGWRNYTQPLTASASLEPLAYSVLFLRLFQAPEGERALLWTPRGKAKSPFNFRFG